MGSLIFWVMKVRPSRGLLDEIAHYNEMCAAGKDTDWAAIPDLMNASTHRRSSAWPAGITKAVAFLWAWCRCRVFW